MAETEPQSNPFMCMDLTYISLLLQEFGFPRNKALKVRICLFSLPVPFMARGAGTLLPACQPGWPFTHAHGPLSPSLCLFQLTRKIDNVETSWALGATFHYIDSLKGQKSWAL